MTTTKTPAPVKKPQPVPPKPQTSPKAPATALPPAYVSKSTEQLSEGREVKYDVLDCLICDGENALTMQQAMEYMGWITEQQFIAEQTEGMTEEERAASGIKFGLDFLLVDVEGNKVRCVNNDHNRPFSKPWAEAIAQDVLNKRWAPDGPNGESIIIGRTGLVLSGQHRLIGLILAGQIWNKALPQFDPTGKDPHFYQRLWPIGQEPTMQTFIAVGVQETNRTINTLDNVRPRTLSDILFCDREMFGGLTKKDRETLCRMTDYAIRMLWTRTGASDSAFATQRTHGAAMSFLERHSSVKKAVKHIWEEDKGFIAKYMSPSYAAAILYLQASYMTDIDEYTPYVKTQDANERLINFDMWDKAEEFWTLFASASKAMPEKTAFEPLCRVLNEMLDPDAQVGPSRINDKLCAISKAWHLFLDNQPLTEDDVRPRTKQDEMGVTHLAEVANFGGIDGTKERVYKSKRKKAEDNGEVAPQETAGQDVTVGDVIGDEFNTGDSSEEGFEEAGPTAHDPGPEELEAAKAREKERRVQEEKSKEEERQKKIEEKKAAKRPQPIKRK